MALVDHVADPSTQFEGFHSAAPELYPSHQGWEASGRRHGWPDFHSSRIDCLTRWESAEGPH